MKKKSNINPVTHSYEEVFTQTEKYFNGDELAATTWINKYALKDEEGNFLELSPSGMHKRMAAEFARIEKKIFSQKKSEKSF